MSDTGETEGPDPVEGHSGHATEGIEQFQKAALDALRAARAMLDAAESIVQDPKAVESVISSVTGLARDATQAVAGFASGAARAANRDPGHGPSDDPGDSDGGFEAINVD